MWKKILFQDPYSTMLKISFNQRWDLLYKVCLILKDHVGVLSTLPSTNVLTFSSVTKSILTLSVLKRRFKHRICKRARFDITNKNQHDFWSQFDLLDHVSSLQDYFANKGRVAGIFKRKVILIKFLMKIKLR